MSRGFAILIEVRVSGCPSPDDFRPDGLTRVYLESRLADLLDGSPQVGL
jgi:hypothetical protein